MGPMGVESKVKAIKKAQLISTGGAKVTDITKNTKLNGESKIDVDLKGVDQNELLQSSNLIIFEFDGTSGSKIFVNKTFDVKMKLSDNIGAKLSQNNKKLLPQHFQFDGGYPRDFNALNTNDNPYLHLEITAGFAGVDESKSRPASVYITLLRDEDMQ